MPARNLDPLFKPKSIAVVGASPTSTGGRVLENIERIGYAGRVYPVHPRHQEVRGLACYPNLAAIPETVDAAVVALPTEAVLQVLTEAGAAGVRAVVIPATGFAEAGAVGLQRQQDLQAIAARHDMLVCGPNCVGVFSFANAQAMYVDVLPEIVTPGPVAAVCQSGTAAITAVTSGRLGLSHLVSIGNEAVIDAAEYLSYFVEDEQTRVIVAFLEGIRSPRLFLDVARRARALGKPLVVFKVGASERAQTSALAHTASLAGSDAVFNAVCEQYGILRVRDFDEMLDTASVLRLLGGRLPKGNRLGSITMSGGQVGMLFDLAAEHGLAFDELQAPTRAKLGQLLGRELAISNPLDAGGTAGDNPLFASAIELIARDSAVDMMAVTSPALINWPRTAQTAEMTIELAASVEKPVLFMTAYAEAIAPAIRASLEAANVPILPATRRGFGTIARSVRYATHLAHLSDGPSDAALNTAEPEIDGRPEIDALLSRGGRTLSEHASLHVLKAYGIPVAQHALVNSSSAAVRAAQDIGYPVALKVCSPDLPHKTEIGAVHLRLADAAAVESAFEDVLERARMTGAAAAIEGVLVAAMAAGTEVIIGSARDPDFGPTVLVGIGGTYAELLNDVSLRLAPVSHAEAIAMFGELRGGAILDGFRGAPAVDKDALADVVVRLGRIAADHAARIDEIDVNPLIVTAAGAVAVDALVVLRGDDDG